MQSVACASARDCWAVGRTTADLRSAHTLIARYNGSDWVPVTDPAADGGHGGALFGVTCARVDACWAAGVSNDPKHGRQQSLIERYNGSAWQVSSAGLPDRAADALYGVACLSVSDCWAVGSVGTAPTHTLIQHYDGSTWAAVNSFDAGASADGVLRAVTCAQANGCWAVGSKGAGRTLIERYDGSSWTIVPSPDTGASDTDTLSGVTCAAGGTCWAVGDYRRRSTQAGLIEEFRGNGWNIVASPAPALSRGSSLAGVACARGSNCWAVGSARSGAGRDRSLVALYNGARWVLVQSPNLGNGADASVASVTCPSVDDCWVVGQCSGVGGAPCRGSRSLIEFYDLILPDGH